MEIVTGGGLTVLLLEAIKFIWRKFVAKDDTFDFPPAYYVVAIPVGNVAMIPVLALIGVPGAAMPSDWAGFAQSVAQVAIASLVTLVGYNAGVKPLKEYNKAYKAKA